MTTFPADYRDILDNPPDPLPRCDLDALRRQREAFRRDVLAPVQAGKYTPRKFPLPASDKGKHAPPKGKRPPKPTPGNHNRTPPAGVKR